MTVLSSAYISLTGLLTFSKALHAISDNVANMNTPGFKSSDLFFNDLQSAQGFVGSDADQGSVPGSGSRVTGAGRVFVQGELRDTGTASNLAIDGAGFFVLRDGDGLFLTRAGQFQLDSQGRLVDPTSKRFVQGLDANGRLFDLVIDQFHVNPPKATSKIAFAGNLSTSGTTHQLTRTIVDAQGTQQTLTFAFTNNGTATPGSWLVKVTDAQGTDLLDGEIRFAPDGSPATGFNTLNLPVHSANGTLSTIALNFGAPGSLDGVTAFSSGSTSTLQVSSADGYGAGRVTGYSFDDKGVLTLSFSNGQTENVGRIALGNVSDPQALKSETGTVFVANQDQAIEFGSPTEAGFGKIAPKSLELSNVELSREFADIIILQRGFQASSQVLNISGQLIETVYNNLSGHR